MKKEQKRCLKCRDTRYRAQKERGITLIALVITIILLLILAGVTLKIVLDNNFIDKAEKSVEKYSEAQKNETEQIKYFLENYLGEVDNIEGKEHRTLNGADPAYNNPIIPVGFKTSSEGASWASIDGKTVQGWNDGLVIEDKDGNQFVWVPVDGENVTNDKWLGNTNTSITSLVQLSDDTLPSGIVETNQITKYGGFYIGRYEAGIPSTLTTAITTADGTSRNVPGTPVVKKNQVPWNYINWTQSKANAESMYTGSRLKSGLITDRMWETTLQWLENAGINVTTDCRGWGNYYNAGVSGITEYSPYGNFGASWTSVSSTTKPADKAGNDPLGSWLLKTGNTEYTKRKNIYDLAGNLWEWTNAAYSSSSSSLAKYGGYYWESGAKGVAAFRFGSSDNAYHYIGFRVGLYVE